jgi:peptide/nickel transport system permease protein
LEGSLGTDLSGRDVWSRLLHAGKVSLSVGLVAVSIYAVIGIVLRAVSGFYGRWVDSLTMRFADVVLAFPSLIIIIIITIVPFWDQVSTT